MQVIAVFRRGKRGKKTKIKFLLDPVRVVESKAKQQLSPRELRRAREIIEANKPEIARKWAAFFGA